jgi:hypothetical protein
MKHFPTFFRILLSGGVVAFIVAATGQHSKPSLMGEWEWVSTQINGEKVLIPATHEKKTTLVYKPDSTVDQYYNGVLVSKGRPFFVKRIIHPSGSGVVDLMVCPDETGFTEPYQTVWLKGTHNDTLVFMGLNPDNAFQPLVYSVYKRVK